MTDTGEGKMRDQSMGASKREESAYVRGPVRSNRLAARLWWALLPYAGWTGYRDGGNPPPWYAWPLTWLWKLVGSLPGSDPFEPVEPVVCTCDYCRGVPGAVFEP